jgi:hypothetical protein
MTRRHNISMNVDEAIEHLNALAGDTVKDQAPMRTTEESLQLSKCSGWPIRTVAA